MTKESFAQVQKSQRGGSFQLQKFAKKIVALDYVLILNTTGGSVVQGTLTFGVYGVVNLLNFVNSLLRKLFIIKIYYRHIKIYYMLVLLLLSCVVLSCIILLT